MKCIVVMFDSLNRGMLEPYGCGWVHTPNFLRLAGRAVRFDCAYVCSMPCIPARREMHTGRANFLHRSWGPLEPFDDSMPEMLKGAGVYTHLATDHQHYFEDGGATYHNRFSTWEFFRGQEGDPWRGVVKRPVMREVVGGWGKSGIVEQNEVNRAFVKSEGDFPQAQTFAAGLEFIRRNHGEDRWFLQIETFDPHEPFVAADAYRDLYAKHHDGYRGKPFEWPAYRKVTETAEEVEHCRYEYAALVSMCDAYLGKVLKAMDEFDLWKDTMLIVCTDHGFMLGERECWGKVWQPFYDEVARVPLFVWDPRCGKKGESRKALVQTVDLAPTVLEFFGVGRTKDMLGKVLRETVATDAAVREAGIFGAHGGQVNVTDGRWVYMRAPVREDSFPLFEYTLMPTHMRARFEAGEMAGMELAEGFGFTKGCGVMKIAGHGAPKVRPHPERFKTMLFDLANDPGQVRAVADAGAERRMVELLMRCMRECEAPVEQYERLGLAI